jgi:hypothetical protein
VPTTGVNVPDISNAVDLLDAVSAVAGRPRRRFPLVLADKGYDSQPFRDVWRRRRTEAIMARHQGNPGFGDCCTGWTVSHPLGTPPRHPQRLRQPRLRPDLLAPIDQLDGAEILLGALAGS